MRAILSQNQWWDCIYAHFWTHQLIDLLSPTVLDGKNDRGHARKNKGIWSQDVIIQATNRRGMDGISIQFIFCGEKKSREKRRSTYLSPKNDSVRSIDHETGLLTIFLRALWNRRSESFQGLAQSRHKGFDRKSCNVTSSCVTSALSAPWKVANWREKFKSIRASRLYLKIKGMTEPSTPNNNLFKPNDKDIW